MAIKQFSNLTPAQTERLACLAEEAGEIVQIVGKILRHGYNSHNPYDADQTSNRVLLEKEIGDLIDRVNLLVENGDLNATTIQKFANAKRQKAKPYMHHQTTEEDIRQ